MSQDSVLQVVERVARALDQCRVEYFVGGSVASSLQGHARSTQDIDVVARLRDSDVDLFVKALGEDFIVDDVALKEAMKLRRSWNIFFAPTMLRVDLFAVAGGEFDEEEMKRRALTEIEPGVSVFVKSPEDTVLRKLLWFKAGSEASSQQLRDVVEVIRVQGERLDGAYLDAWATKLGIGELLARARDAAK